MWRIKNGLNEEKIWYSQEELDKAVEKAYQTQWNELFNDSYFQGLTVKQVIELAKKSIRITTCNRNLEHKIEDLLEYCFYLKSENYETVRIDNVVRLLNESERNEENEEI